LSGEGFQYVHQFYTASPGSATTAASVPVLWDRHSRRVVSNDSGDIAAMFNSEFDAFSRCVHCRPLEPSAMPLR
jgi:putative glutathione S-transferase